MYVNVTSYFRGSLSERNVLMTLFLQVETSALDFETPNRFLKL